MYVFFPAPTLPGTFQLSLITTIATKDRNPASTFRIECRLIALETKGRCARSTMKAKKRTGARLQRSLSCWQHVILCFLICQLFLGLWMSLRSGDYEEDDEENNWRIPAKGVRFRMPKITDKCHKDYNAFPFPAEGGCTETRSRVHCQFSNLRLNTTKILSRARGGEALHSVMGQAEDVEFLRYQKGAFLVPSLAGGTLPKSRPGHVAYTYIGDVLNAMQQVDKDEASNIECIQRWPGTTLFLTRYEYVNLYHTMTDWWNTLFSVPWHSGHLSLPINMVFLDAHPQGSLDPVWRHLFGNFSHVGHLSSGVHCFDRVRLIPPGYVSPMLRSRCPDERMGHQIVQFFLDRYNLTQVQRIPGRVVVLDRVPYVAHPRSNPKGALRTLDNLKELALGLPDAVASHGGKHNLTVQVATLVEDDFVDQIKLIRQAHVLIANHGAGLTHSLFLEDGAHVIELSCEHGFFPALMKWRPKVRHYCSDIVRDRIPESFWNTKVLPIVKEALNEYR